MVENLFMSTFRFFRRLVYQFFVHSFDTFYDFLRYTRFSNSFFRLTNDEVKLEAMIFFYYHKVEKALALPEVKPLFGISVIETLLDLLERWVEVTGDLEAVVFRGAYASLVEYRHHVDKLLPSQNPGLIKRIDSFLIKYKTADKDLNMGGTITIHSKELQDAWQSVDFEHFVLSRHSVRNFSEQIVPDSAIVHAVRLAQKSPSVCNRQCWRVHVFSSAADIARVLQHQNGNRGFDHVINRLLLVTADLRTFVSSGERNQAFVDAGLFSMTLVLALQSQGIVSCCLNLCLSFAQDKSLRETCNFPSSETPIMMIAIGYPPEKIKVATSARKTTGTVLRFRDLKTEEREIAL